MPLAKAIEFLSFVDLRPLEEDGVGVRAAIERVIASGRYVLGPEVEAFEQEFAAAAGARHAVGVGSGTDALALILHALDIGTGDEVIVPALTSSYAALAVVMRGARPVFADVDPVRLTMDAESCAALVTPRTRALLATHLYGQAADLTALQSVATRHHVALIEDCCQAHLATCRGVPVGVVGLAGAFSFYPTKNLGALGDGGAIVTRNAALADRLRCLRNGGQIDRARHQDAGVNSRLDEIQAAILRARLAYLPMWTEQRRAHACTYRRLLENAPVAVPPEIDAGHVYNLFPVRSVNRDRLQSHLRDAGVETLVHYPLALTEQPAFEAYGNQRCLHAEYAARELLSLPLYPRLTSAEIARIAAAVCTFKPLEGTAS